MTWPEAVVYVVLIAGITTVLVAAIYFGLRDLSDDGR